MERKKEPAPGVWQAARAYLALVGSVEVQESLLMRTQDVSVKNDKETSAELRVGLKNGPELRRLLEVLADATVVAEDLGSAVEIAQAKSRLKEQLSNLGWLKRLIKFD